MSVSSRETNRKIADDASRARPSPAVADRRAVDNAPLGRLSERIRVTKSECHSRPDLARSAPVPKYVYDFSEGNRDMKDLLGGKGANLAEMTNLGLPVPP